MRVLAESKRPRVYNRGKSLILAGLLDTLPILESSSSWISWLTRHQARRLVMGTLKHKCTHVYCVTPAADPNASNAEKNAAQIVVAIVR